MEETALFSGASAGLSARAREEGRVLVLQHHPAEGPGMLGDHLTRAGLELTSVALDRGDPIPPLPDFDAMVVMGGPMDVWQEDAHPWLVAEKAAIREWVAELERPYLGVCLGHQLLAAALGGVVAPMTQPEIGVTEVALTVDGQIDPLLAELAPAVPALEWHGAEVTGLPPGGVVLAGTSACSTQALRVGPMAWSVQFHIEASAAVVTQWAAIPEYRTALTAIGDGDPGWLHRAVVEQSAAMATACAAVGAALLGHIRSHRAAGGRLR